jgi:hypothetical protein
MCSIGFRRKHMLPAKTVMVLTASKQTCWSHVPLLPPWMRVPGMRLNCPVQCATGGSLARGCGAPRSPPAGAIVPDGDGPGGEPACPDWGGRGQLGIGSFCRGQARAHPPA